MRGVIKGIGAQAKGNIYESSSKNMKINGIYGQAKENVGRGEGYVIKEYRLA